MSLYAYVSDCFEPVSATSFAEEGILERTDLQRLFAQQLNLLVPDAMVLTDEYGDWDGSQRRIDLLVLDSQANLVVVELKRTAKDGQLDLQAVRYAAMASTLTFDQAVAAHAHYLGCSTGEAEDAVLSFLELSEPDLADFNQSVRIVLVAADFHKEVTTSVLWLNEHNLDITCIRVKPYQHNQQVLLQIEPIIPLREAEDYLVRARGKSTETRWARSQNWADSGGFWFVNVGDKPNNTRSWEDCRKYGFVLAGGGLTWSDQIKQLSVGDQFFAYLSGHGYVGLGEVVHEAVMQRDFVPQGDWGGKKLLDLPLKTQPSGPYLDDPDRCDWCVGVRWLDSVSREEAHKLASRRQTVCRLKDADLVGQLLERFNISDSRDTPAT
ncbi:MAG: hypothetical protein AAF662_05385 [Pseudomonadota bacterium]